LLGIALILQCGLRQRRWSGRAAATDGTTPPAHVARLRQWRPLMRKSPVLEDEVQRGYLFAFPPSSAGPLGSPALPAGSGYMVARRKVTIVTATASRQTSREVSEARSNR